MPNCQNPQGFVDDMAPASPVFAGESAPTETGTPRLSIRPFSREDATDSCQHLTTSLTHYISPSGFVYPVATDNLPSRLIAEALGGSVTGTRTAAKLANGSYRPIAASREGQQSAKSGR